MIRRWQNPRPLYNHLFCSKDMQLYTNHETYFSLKEIFRYPINSEIL